MDLLHAFFLFVAGLAGGVISTLAGGAAVITFPALLATGISPVFATATNMAALVPGNFLAVLFDRSQLPPLGRSFFGLAAASLTGAVVGGALLLLTPERVFAKLVPLLLGFATVLFAFAGHISTWLRERAQARGEQGQNWSRMIAWLLPVSIYGGYFGAGLGVLVLGVVSVATGGDYRSANVTKNLVVSINSAVVATFFASQALVVWPQALLMMAGVPIGALIGVRLARILPNSVARSLVVGVGALLTVAFAWRYWL
jgi:uncharacterized membrane protein YfcA